MITFMLMAILVIFGLFLGSFVNALVWRLRQQELENDKKKPDQFKLRKLSISRGKSMCPHCQHKLAASDLVPVFSWLWLRGKCRYCHKPISPQYPIVESATAALFAASYIWWPVALNDTPQVSLFVIWLLLLTGFVALTVYDLRWYLLPDRIVAPLGALAALFAIITIATSDDPAKATLSTALAVVVGGGVFWALYQISDGKWIGGGDVKLGWVLGAVAGTPARSLLLIFLASLLGTAVSLPLLASKRLKKKHIIPFGPFLMAGLFIVQLWGTKILDWYTSTFINV